jgi:hypothetical protein
MINFSAGKLIAVPTTLADGSAIALPQPVVLGDLQDVTIDLSVETKMLYGSGKYPIAVGQGKAKSQIKAKYANISGAILGSLFLGKTATAGIKDAVIDQAINVPAASPYTLTVAPPSSGTFVENLGIRNATTGDVLTRVASAPTTGQYSVNASGQYTFAAADASAGLLASYEFSATSSTAQTFDITNDQMGYAPSFSLMLRNSFDGKSMVLKLNRCISGKLNIPLKNDDFALFDFEADAFANAAGKVGYICLY